jgi:hypothetical protein
VAAVVSFAAKLDTLPVSVPKVAVVVAAGDFVVVVVDVGVVVDVVDSAAAVDFVAIVRLHPIVLIRDRHLAVLAKINLSNINLTQKETNSQFLSSTKIVPVFSPVVVRSHRARSVQRQKDICLVYLLLAQ